MWDRSRQYLYVSYGGTGIVGRPMIVRTVVNTRMWSISLERHFAPCALSVGRISPVSVTPIGWAPMTAKGFLPRDALLISGLTHDDIRLYSSPLIRSRSVDEWLMGRKYDRPSLKRDEGMSPMSFLVRWKVMEHFGTDILIPETTGKYALVLASGNSFNTLTFSRIELIDRNTLFLSCTEWFAREDHSYICSWD